MLEPPHIRIGWLKMLLRVLRKTGGRPIYATLIRDVERLIAAAEREAR